MNRSSAILFGATAAILLAGLPVASLLEAREAGTARAEQPADVWAPFRPFIGSWKGVGKGSPGTSELRREYKFILDGQFLLIRNEAVFKPQEKNPKGEVHGDWGIISYDQGRKKFVLREFHTEGYVNQYVLDSISADGKKMVFTTEAVENGPPGLRARITTQMSSNNEFAETFELSFSGKPFSPCVEAKLTRDK